MYPDMGANAIYTVIIAYQYVVDFNTQVMSWMTSQVKLSDDVDHAFMMSWMMSQQILSDDAVSRFSIKSLVIET